MKNYGVFLKNKNIEYTIFFQPRSGSTLLCEFLEDTGVCGIPKETFSNYWLEQLKDEISINAKNNTAEYIREMKKRFTSPNGVYGHKIALYHIDSFLERANFSDYYSSSYLFYITRKDKVYQSISDYIAMETQQWAKMKNSDTHKDLEFEVIYNKEKIKNKFSYHINNEMEMDSFFKSNNLNIRKVISYEELCKNPNEIIRGIASELGVSYSEKLMFTLDGANLQKQSTIINKDFAERFIIEEKNYINEQYKKLEGLC